MDSYTNIGVRIIAGIICIVIGIGSFQIAYETYEEIDRKNYELETMMEPGVDDSYKFEYRRDFWYKVRSRQQSNRFAILYSSVFVFSISLCCFTYICVKK